MLSDRWPIIDWLESRQLCGTYRPAWPGNHGWLLQFLILQVLRQRARHTIFFLLSTLFSQYWGYQLALVLQLWIRMLLDHSPFFQKSLWRRSRLPKGIRLRGALPGTSIGVDNHLLLLEQPLIKLALDLCKLIWSSGPSRQILVPPLLLLGEADIYFHFILFQPRMSGREVLHLHSKVRCFAQTRRTTL